MTPDLQARAPNGVGVVRAAAPGETVDGVVPGLVVEPGTPEQMAAALAWASRERLRTVVRGGGTKLDWGREPAAVDVVVSSLRLDRLIAHRHGDLTATIAGGATLASVTPQLALERQWLPIDTAFAGATIGGIVATNDAGPLRHRYGTPRDLLIGISLALPDGRLAKAGGHVVKNVAGYDMGKLMSGSHGTLAAIVDATFRLLPIPAASSTVDARFAEGAALARAAQAVGASQLEPAAFDVHAVFGGASPGGRGAHALYVRFATSPAATAAQVESAEALMTGAQTSVVSGDAERMLWDEQLRRPWSAGGAVIRLSWLPAALPAVLDTVENLQRSGGGVLELTARAGVGTGLLRVDAGEDAQHAAVRQLRDRRDVVGSVVVLRASRGLKQRVDVWGDTGPASVMNALKQTFDPSGIMNAGRGPN